MAVFSARKCLLILKVSNFPPLKTDAKIKLSYFLTKQNRIFICFTAYF